MVMDLYSVSLALGGAGLGVMALSGLGHAISHSGGHADGLRAGGQLNVHGHGHTHLHGVKASHSHVQGARGHGGARAGALKGTTSQRLWMLLSPRVLFSALVGFGATGLAARALSGGPR